MESSWFAYAKRIQSIADTGMTFATDDFDKERFNATWTFAKTALDSMPQVQMTSMLADLEQRGMDSWMPDFGATMKACTDNLQAQQVHVDSWRGLATSGLLEFE